MFFAIIFLFFKCTAALDCEYKLKYDFHRHTVQKTSPLLKAQRAEACSDNKTPVFLHRDLASEFQHRLHSTPVSLLLDMESYERVVEHNAWNISSYVQKLECEFKSETLASV